MAADFQQIFNMVSTSLLRTLPPDRDNNSHAYHKKIKKPKKEDPEWPLFKPIYELLLLSLESLGSDAAAKYVDSTFLVNLLGLFDSMDHRERRFVKKVVICVYSKFQWLQPFLRKSIGSVFYTFVFETERHNGIAEILQVVEKIVDGFVLPLKGDDKVFLARSLIPLHGPNTFPMYRKELCKCLVLFLRKDPTNLADTVVHGILKYWPLTNCSKEICFLVELDKIVQVIKPADLRLRLVSLFRQLGRCLSSPHRGVAKRAFSLLTNQILVEIIKLNKGTVLPMLIPALEKARRQWKGMVQESALQAWNIIFEIDPVLFQKCLIKSNKGNEERDQIQLKREATWKRLEEIAAMDATDGRREATWKSLESKQNPRCLKITIRKKPLPKVIVRVPEMDHPPKKRPMPKITIRTPSGKRVKLN